MIEMDPTSNNLTKHDKLFRYDDSCNKASRPKSGRWFVRAVLRDV